MPFVEEIMLTKEQFKKIRTFAQIIFLVAAGLYVAQLFWERYAPPVFDRESWTQHDGFMAISYGSMTREPTPGFNSRQQFKAHLSALKAAGYHWITAQDIVDFYDHGKPLPENALYLMLEGGRKDNVIFGQPIIGEAGAHAGFYMYTGTLSSWSNFFVTFSQAATLAHSPFWDLGSQGVGPLRINEDLKGIEPAGFLCDFLRNADGQRTESTEAMFNRLEAYYIKSSKPIARFLDGLPSMYIMTPANSFNTRMPDDIERANYKLMAKYFQAAFTKEGPAFNSALENIYGLSRMQVNPDWDSEQLLQRLKKWSFDRKSFTMAEPDAADDWAGFRTKIKTEGNSLVLEPQEGYVDPVILSGSSLWENTLFSFTFDKREPYERYVYLRYVSRESYIRISIQSNRLLIQERLPNEGLYTHYDSVLRVLPPWKFTVQLIGSRIRVSVDGNSVSGEDLPVSPRLIRGAIALGTAPEKDIQARFANVEAERLPTVWRLDREGSLPSLYSPLGMVCASILPIADTDGLARQLMNARSLGMMAIAALPKGKTDFSMDDLSLVSLGANIAQRMWNGVMLEPEANTNWTEVDKTLNAIAADGKHPILRLSRDAAISLVNSGKTMPVDYLVLDFKKSDLSPAQWTKLAHRHNRNFFLYSQFDAKTGSNDLYTVVR